MRIAISPRVMRYVQSHGPIGINDTMQRRSWLKVMKRVLTALFLAAPMLFIALQAIAQENDSVVDPNAFTSTNQTQTSGSSNSQTPSSATSSFFVRPKSTQSASPPNPGTPSNSASSYITPNQLLGQFLHGQANTGSLQNMIMGEARQLKSEFVAEPAHNMLQFTAEDRRELSNCDLAIIIDHSGSMKTRDCPGFSYPGGLNSRLEWVVDELMIFANNIMYSMPHGFSLITFDSNPEAFQISNVDELRQVLGSLSSGGGTRLEAAIDKAFSLHQAHRDQPLLIAVITDGEVNVRESEQVIAKGTRAFPLPNGVAITILQVGAIAEQTTAPRLQALCNLMPMGAAYDPLTGVPFSRLRRDGLGNDVLLALRSSFRLR
jgi:von Willebrand factor type A domain